MLSPGTQRELLQPFDLLFEGRYVCSPLLHGHSLVFATLYSSPPLLHVVRYPRVYPAVKLLDLRTYLVIHTPLVLDVLSLLTHSLVDVGGGRGQRILLLVGGCSSAVEYRSDLFSLYLQCSFVLPLC